MFSKMKIGDFAELNSISIQTLRYYEKLGLIKPSYSDPQTNYRYYNLNQSANVDVIQFLKSFDFSLREIEKMLVESDNLFLLKELIAKQQEELVAEKVRIETKINTLQSFSEAMEIYEENKDKKTMELIDFPVRYMYSYPIHKNIFEMTNVEYEVYLREFKQYLVGKGIPVGSFNRVGSLMKRSDFVENNFVSKLLFVFVQKKAKGISPIGELPAGNHAVYYCRSFEEELPAIPHFKKKIEEQQLQIVGDYICEVIYEIPKNILRQRRMFIRLQVPVVENNRY